MTPPFRPAGTAYRFATVAGLRLFYREAGPPDAPVILMLHGYPSSSRMWARLIPLLADRYRLIAPDYPGFGHSDAPSPDAFAYTFDRLAELVEGLADALGIRRYALLQQDYGGPIGMRLALRRPERVRAILIQNAVAHDEGLGPLWESRRAYWRDRVAHEEVVIGAFTSLEGARQRHLGTSPSPERYDPDSWTDEAAFLARPGQRRTQAGLFYDYRTNVASYPAWQAWLRAHRPPLLVLWGRYDPSFAVAGAYAYLRDVPDAEVHILDAGHFALDEKLEDCAVLIREFLARRLR
ncbi:alpha/beta fold hydrolase [Sphingomonas sp. Sphisp140]|uniref:alpha/beta fold hydrolase n=1 Tax=unclassified Sphingomonas TaxID=196159 RepID=UPI0039AFD7C8